MLVQKLRMAAIHLATLAIKIAIFVMRLFWEHAPKLKSQHHTIKENFKKNMEVNWNPGKWSINSVRLSLATLLQDYQKLPLHKLRWQGKQKGIYLHPNWYCFLQLLHCKSKCVCVVVVVRNLLALDAFHACFEMPETQLALAAASYKTGGGGDGESANDQVSYGPNSNCRWGEIA